MRRFKAEHEQQSSNTKHPTRTQMMMAAHSLVEEEINGEKIICAICLHSSKGDTESTEFKMQKGQNASTRIRQSLPPRLWKSLGRPVATKEKSWLWCCRTH